MNTLTWIECSWSAKIAFKVYKLLLLCQIWGSVYFWWVLKATVKVEQKVRTLTLAIKRESALYNIKEVAYVNKYIAVAVVTTPFWKSVSRWQLYNITHLSLVHSWRLQCTHSSRISIYFSPMNMYISHIEKSNTSLLVLSQPEKGGTSTYVEIRGPMVSPFSCGWQLLKEILPSYIAFLWPSHSCSQYSFILNYMDYLCPSTRNFRCTISYILLYRWGKWGY